MKLTDKGIKFCRALLCKRTPLPIEAQVEITTRCNLSCPMCPRHNMHLEPRDMPLNVFDKIVKRLTCIRYIVLTGWGEPLMHPDFFTMVKLIPEYIPDSEIRFTTNGYLLNGDFRSRVLNSPVNRITVSMDSMDNSIKEGHIHSEIVAENIRSLLNERGKNKHPEVILQSTIHSNGVNKIKGLIEYAAQVGIDTVNLARLQVSSQNDVSLIRPTFNEERKMIRESSVYARGLNISISFINSQRILRLAGHFDRLCLRTIDHVYINVEGKVSPCCNLANLIMGDLLEEDIETIWKGDKFLKFYKSQELICDGCDALKYRYHN